MAKKKRESKNGKPKKKIEGLSDTIPPEPEKEPTETKCSNCGGGGYLQPASFMSIPKRPCRRCKTTGIDPDPPKKQEKVTPEQAMANFGFSEGSNN